jgi:type IV pilus assembly protein PilE
MHPRAPCALRPASRARPRGFTLIEVMIALAVVALLVAIAWPAYFEQIARGRRSDVQTQLMDDANYMQRYYASNNTYATAAAASLPAPQSPLIGAANYNITIASQSATSFELVGARAGAMAGDKCGDFTYDNLGTKGLSGTGQAVTDCWR